MIVPLRALAKRIPGGRWILLALAFAAIVLADYRYLGLTRIVDQRAGDILLAWNAARRPVSDRVVIVDIDQRSLEEMEELAGSWPWPRSIHGELVDAIARQKPRAIAFDVMFDGRDVYRPEHDASFAEVVAAHPNVWLAMALADDGEGALVSDMPAAVGARPLRDPPVDARVPLLLPLAVLERPEAMRGGLINFTEDSDTVGRRHALYRDRAGWRFASLAARIMEDLGRPLAAKQTVLLNWREGWTHIAYVDLYRDALRQRPLRPADELAGKIVIVGTAAPGLLDLRLTPMGSTYPGVEILATAIDNLDRGDWLRETQRGTMAALALGLIALVGVGFGLGISANRLGWGLFAVTAATLAAAWLMLTGGTFVPVFGALAFAWAFYLLCSAIDYLEQRTQRLRTSGMFKRFVDHRVVADLIAQGDFDPRNTAQSREVSVLFSDIRGFTALSEVSRAEDVVALLNDYFSQQVAVIFAHGGTLDKFIGDAIMAFWGAPVDMPDHAARAVSAALEMSAALDALRDQLGALGASLEIGIGVHSGRAVVGFIGSRERLDYTVIGDTVNLASRVESATKGLARVLVTEATRDLAGDAFSWRVCGEHKVKGREAPVRLFEPLGKSDI